MNRRSFLQLGSLGAAGTLTGATALTGPNRLAGATALAQAPPAPFQAEDHRRPAGTHQAEAALARLQARAELVVHAGS